MITGLQATSIENNNKRQASYTYLILIIWKRK